MCLKLALIRPIISIARLKSDKLVLLQPILITVTRRAARIGRHCAFVRIDQSPRQTHEMWLRRFACILPLFLSRRGGGGLLARFYLAILLLLGHLEEKGRRKARLLIDQVVLEVGIGNGYGIIVHVGVKNHLTDQKGTYEQKEHYSTKTAQTRFKSVHVRFVWGMTRQEQSESFLK